MGIFRWEQLQDRLQPNCGVTYRGDMGLPQSQYLENTPQGLPPVSSMENPHNFFRWFSQLDISISSENSIIWMIFNCHLWLPVGYFHRAVKFETTPSSGNWQPWRFQGPFWLHLCPQVNDSNFQRFRLVEPRLQFRWKYHRKTRHSALSSTWGIDFMHEIRLALRHNNGGGDHQPLSWSRFFPGRTGTRCKSNCSVSAATVEGLPIGPRVATKSFYLVGGVEHGFDFSIPIGSMYAIYGNIYHQYTPNVSIYTIHGSYGIAKCSMTIWFSDVFRVPWELSLEIPGKFEVCLNPEEHAGAEEICRWMAWRWRWTKVWISWFLLRLTIQKCWFLEIYNDIYIYLQSKSWLMEY